MSHAQEIMYASTKNHTRARTGLGRWEAVGSTNAIPGDGIASSAMTGSARRCPPSQPETPTERSTSSSRSSSPRRRYGPTWHRIVSRPATCSRPRNSSTTPRTCWPRARSSPATTNAAGGSSTSASARSPTRLLDRHARQLPQTWSRSPAPAAHRQGRCLTSRHHQPGFRQVADIAGARLTRGTGPRARIGEQGKPCRPWE